MMQADNRDKFTYKVLKGNVSIQVDGLVSPGEWSSISTFSKFINKWPIDTGIASAQTQVKITYDDQYLYVMAKCQQKREDLVIQTLKRDNSTGYWGSDAFAFIVDPINQRSNGFLFGVTAGGAQMEATLNMGRVRTEFDENWDTKWFSATAVYDDHWVAEMAIPFNAIRYNPQNLNWGVNFVRNDMKNNVYSTWAHVPLGFPGIDLGHMGSLQWNNIPATSGKKIILIPYASGGLGQDFEENEDPKSSGDIGLDAKIAISSSLNLDLTVNPDFSNVDVDRQVTNLSRFSIFFPERRGFFLENSDLFTNYGTFGITPFFSRTIGLHDGDPVPILFGARLSGNLTQHLRVGIMDIQTSGNDEVDPSNYFVTAIQHQVLKRSRIKALITNRQASQSNESESAQDYNRTGGLEFDYISENGKLLATAKYHSAFDENNLDKNTYYTIGGGYNDGRFFGGFYYNHVGENYVSDLGFVPRLEHEDPVADTTIRVGFNRINSWAGYVHRPKNGKINNMEFNPWNVLFFNDNGDFMERITGFAFEMSMKSRQRFFLEIENNEIQLQVPADLIDDDTPLPIDRYNNTFVSARWRTDNRKTISASFGLGAGSFYTGDRKELSVTVNYRKQPWGNLSFSYTQNRVDLGELYGETVLHLLGPSAEISFSNSMFWTTFLQYNTQDENFNINSRFQWRYKPMSDIFLVYSENYATTNLAVKNRGVVFKMTHWLNL